MTAPNVRTATAALDAARPLLQRLDVGRDPEDVAADLLEAWSQTETALRAFLGGSGLGGQALVRELRQRERLTLEQAHALLEFLSARDRANRPSYRPTSADIGAAREGFQRLEEALAVGGVTPAAYAAAAGFAGAGSMYGPPGAGAGGGTAGGAGTPALPYATGGYAGAAPHSAPPLDGEVTYVPSAEGRGPGRLIAGLVAVLLLLGVGTYFLFGRGGGRSAAVDEAVALYSQGKREAARAAFEKIARDDPSLATPHIYLGRIAREDGDLRTAQNELQRAVRLEPSNSVALREMGSYLLSAGNYDLARKFYVRAVQANPRDKSAQGFLACALVRLGRTAEAQTFFQRAGQGPWSACAAPLTGAPGAFPQPAPGQQLPPAPR